MRGDADGVVKRSEGPLVGWVGNGLKVTDTWEGEKVGGVVEVGEGCGRVQGKLPVCRFSA